MPLSFQSQPMRFIYPLLLMMHKNIENSILEHPHTMKVNKSFFSLPHFHCNGIFSSIDGNIHQRMSVKKSSGGRSDQLDGSHPAIVPQSYARWSNSLKLPCLTIRSYILYNLSAAVASSIES